MQTFTFDLRGQKVPSRSASATTGDFTASYISLMGLGEILGDADVMIDAGAAKQYVDAGLGAGQPESSRS